MTEASEPLNEGADTPRASRAGRLLVALPLLFFLGLAGVFLYQLASGHDASEVPSVLIGKSAPKTVLPPLPGLTQADGAPVPGLDLAAAGDGRPVLVNVFASWCAPCREEHPLLMQLAKDRRVRLVGINYKDKQPENARGFLTDLGNPYAAVGYDPAGQSTIDWGVYGVPETFLVGTDGTILWKQTGPFTPQAIESGLIPALDKALKQAN